MMEIPPYFVAGVIGFIVTMTVALGALPGNTQAQNSDVSTVENLRQNINNRCEVINKQSRENYLAENYTFESTSSIDINSGKLSVERKNGGKNIYSLESGCTYSWGGIKPGNAKWEINVSATNTNNPDVQITATKQ